MVKLIGSISLFLVGMLVQAQLEPLTNQYLLNTLSINPAYAGNREALSITMLHRNQWTGFEGSPKTLSLAMHALMRNEKIGFGFLAVNDQVGISSSSIITGNFAYRIRTGDGVFSFGLAGGITYSKNNWNSLVAVDKDDALILQDSRGYYLPDFSIGLYYHSERFFFGFSLPMFLSHDFDASSGTFNVVNNYSEYNYLMNAGYLLRPTSVKVLPSVLIRFTPLSTPQADLNLHLIFFDRIQTGLSYRSNKSIVGLLMYHVNNQFAIAYSYDMGLGRIGGYMGGSHEIMIRYDFRYIIDVINPRYF
jgi:type IX secretion system PorP/SprF family membrane protein